MDNELISFTILLGLVPPFSLSFTAYILKKMKLFENKKISRIAFPAGMMFFFTLVALLYQYHLLAGFKFIYLICLFGMLGVPFIILGTLMFLDPKYIEKALLNSTKVFVLPSIGIALAIIIINWIVHFIKIF